MDVKDVLKAADDVGRSSEYQETLGCLLERFEEVARETKGSWLMTSAGNIRASLPDGAFDINVNCCPITAIPDNSGKRRRAGEVSSHARRLLKPENDKHLDTLVNDIVTAADNEHHAGRRYASLYIKLREFMLEKIGLVPAAPQF